MAAIARSDREISKLLDQMESPGTEFIESLDQGKEKQLVELEFIRKNAKPETYQAQRQKVLGTLTALEKIREKYNQDNAMPVYTPVRGELPRYRMAPVAAYGTTPKFQGIPIDGTPPTSIRPVAVTEELLNDAVREFSTQPMLVLATVEDACFARASVKRDQLILRGVPESRIEKIFFIFPNGGTGFTYHVALVVTLDDGSKRVVDPYVDDRQCLEMGSWSKTFGGDPSRTPTPLRVQTTDLSRKGMEMRTYTAPHKTIVRVLGEQLRVEPETESVARESAQLMSDLRTGAERVFIESYINEVRNPTPSA